MQVGFNVGEHVVITSDNVRFGQQGKIINRLDRIRTIYAVEFEDGSIGFFEGSEIRKQQDEQDIINIDTLEKELQ